MYVFEVHDPICFWTEFYPLGSLPENTIVTYCQKFECPTEIRSQRVRQVRASKRKNGPN